jgi:hypothetical protein
MLPESHEEVLMPMSHPSHDRRLAAQLPTRAGTVAVTAALLLCAAGTSLGGLLGLLAFAGALAGLGALVSLQELVTRPRRRTSPVLFSG